jgi:hypothetical protein
VHPVALTQAEHQARLLDQLDAHSRTRLIADNMRSCAFDARRRWTRRTRQCRHPWCMDCRKAFIGHRVAAGRRLFAGQPRDAQHFVTVLLDVSPFLTCVPADLRPDPRRTSRAAADLPPDSLSNLLRQARRLIDRGLRRAKPHSLLAAGAFEFEVLDLQNLGAQKARFLTDFVADRVMPPSPDALLLHAHFLLVAERDGRHLDAQEIGSALRAVMPCRHQVVVDPLQADKPFATAQFRALSYPLKGFSDFRAERVRELAVALSQIRRRALVFERKWGMRANAGRA